MADQVVQITAGSGTKVDVSELTVGANTVERQRIVLTDDATAAALAKVRNSAPGTTDYGLVTRPLLATDGTNTETIKGGSTASVVGDTSQVVQQHPLSAISLGVSQGKTVIGVPGTIVTTATTADQVIVTYTVTAGKTFYLEGFDVFGRLTTVSSTPTNMGVVSLEIGAGTKKWTQEMAGVGTGFFESHDFTEPWPIAAGTVIRIVITPAAATSFTWRANLLGYEK